MVARASLSFPAALTAVTANPLLACCLLAETDPTLINGTPAEIGSLPSGRSTAVFTFYALAARWRDYAYGPHGPTEAN